MDAALRNHVHGSQLNLEEKKAAESSSCDDQDGPCEETNLKVGNGKRGVGDDYQKDMSHREHGSNMPKMDMSSSDFDSKVSSSVQKKQDELLESAKTEMGEVMEENQRLRVYLEQIMKDYKALQMQFHDAVLETNKPSSTISSVQESEETEFVSLSLGRTSSSEMKKSEDSGKNPSKEIVDEMEEDKEGLALGLDCKFRCPKAQQSETSPNPSPETSVEELKEENMETWPPHKGVKTTRTVEDEVPQQNPTKRARVSVRVRCDTPTMNDGCQWRKYGQKIAKGNPCPRAYYRCTVAPNCPVRKQVQRCADDMSILITTYEGTHNHPLPLSATAMASTTSAAACMLLSGSTTSGTASTSSASATLSTSSNLNGLNFYLSENSKPKPPFYIPNSSISSSPSYPTITLDLTTNTSAAAHINKMSNFPPRYSSTNLSFSSLDSTPLPTSWTNGMLNYGHANNSQTYNKNQISPLNFGRQNQEALYQSYLQKGILNSSAQQSLPAETIAAATKAITADPSFQSVLAAALTSIMGSGANNSNQVEKSAQNLKLSENFPVLSSFSSSTNSTTATNGNKCASSFLNKSSNNSTTNSSQPGSLMFLSSSSMPFTSSNTKSTSPTDKRDHIS